MASTAGFPKITIRAMEGKRRRKEREHRLLRSCLEDGLTRAQCLIRMKFALNAEDYQIHNIFYDNGVEFPKTFAHMTPEEQRKQYLQELSLEG